MRSQFRQRTVAASMQQALLLGRDPEGHALVRWRALIFTSHAAAAWGERMWEFSAGLLLLALGGGESLQLPSALAFSMLLTQALLGSKVGRLVDGSHPLRTPLAALACQQVGIALAALSAAAFIELDIGGEHRVLLGASCVIAFSCLAKLSALVSKISVENHWAVALAVGGREELAQLNGQMRRIDLTCKIIAPMLSGLLMSWYSPAAAGCATALFNICAWPVEVVCLRLVYRDSWCQGRLHESAQDSKPASPGVQPQEERSAWKLYFSQKSVWRSALALSMLHLTVLSFGVQMTAYVKILGVDPALISVYRGVGEVFGLTATYVAPWMVKHLGWSGAYAGLLFIWFQLACMVPSAIGASNWARRTLTPINASLLLVGGVGVSRLGLWGFDLSVSQLLQERIDPSARGAIMGVQKALEASFGTLAALLGVLFPEPDQFQYLACVSWMAICSGALLHSSTLLRGQ